MFPLEDAGPRTLTTRGIRFRKGDYVGPWMTGQAGIQVRIRCMPHHDHRHRGLPRRRRPGFVTDVRHRLSTSLDSGPTSVELSRSVTAGTEWPFVTR
ncbi:Mu transposase C-terminal domain-containing protein [Streptomyces sp. NPDC029044]|uniref:Mu transposase C-terminal domain-containing protein n=1 Tax=Streptomyces sp. NPDC029044 TaxID=3157198 RepID=UPI0033CE467A